MRNFFAMVYGTYSGVGHADFNELDPLKFRRFLRDRFPGGYEGTLMVGGGDGGGGGGGFGGGGGGGVGGTQGGGGGPAAAAAATGSGGGSYNQGPWLFPPSDYINLDIGPNANTGVVALPAVGATAVILTYKAPQGRYAKVSAIGIDFIANGGAAFVQGLAAPTLQFGVFIDGVPVPGLGNFNYLQGSVSSPNGTAGFFVKNGQTLTIRVKNLSLAVTTQSLAARIQGYLISKTLFNQKRMGYA